MAAEGGVRRVVTGAVGRRSQQALGADSPVSSLYFVVACASRSNATLNGFPESCRNMLEAFKSYFHRISERQKFYRQGRRRTVYRIFHNSNAMSLSWLGLENDRGEIVIAWKDAVRIEAFKRDLYTVDLICLSVLLKDNKAVEINEEMEGWESLVNKLPEYFSGCQKFEEWFQLVAFPAFKPNNTTIYQRELLSRLGQ